MDVSPFREKGFLKHVDSPSDVDAAFVVKNVTKQEWTLRFRAAHMEEYLAAAGAPPNGQKVGMHTHTSLGRWQSEGIFVEGGYRLT